MSPVAIIIYEKSETKRTEQEEENEQTNAHQEQSRTEKKKIAISQGGTHV